MKYQWLLFDADNTLFDFSVASHFAFDDLITEIGLAPSDTLYNEYKIHNHLVWKEFEQGIINSIELRPKRFRLFFEATDIDFDPSLANDIYLTNLVKHAVLIKGTLEVLDTLKSKGYKMIIITNGLKEVQRPRIIAANMDQYFEHIVVSDEIGIAKPHSDFFGHAHRLIGSPDKSEVLVIGDSLSSDIAGGINFGYDTCWYNYHRKRSVDNSPAKYAIESLDQLFKLI